MDKPQFNVLGKITPRKDGVARVTGQETYTVDMSLPRMLYGRTVCSPYAHARIKSIDTSAAEAWACSDWISQKRYNGASLP
jgi:CO/xanthine dehydrogenase Mo-binding subunit